MLHVPIHPNAYHMSRFGWNRPQLIGFKESMY